MSASTRKLSPRRRSRPPRPRWCTTRRTKSLAHHPLPGALLAHRHVLDDHLAAAVAHGDRAVEDLRQHQRLGGPLLEPAHVHHAGGDHLTGVHARDASDRQEHPAATGHLHDEPDGARGQSAGPEDDDDVPDPPHLVALRVEDGEAGQAGDEDPRRRSAHAVRLAPRTLPKYHDAHGGRPRRAELDVVDVFTDTPFEGNRLAMSMARSR